MTNAIGKEWGVLRKLFLRDEHSDCEIYAANEGRVEARFPCHKNILGMTSEFFAHNIKNGILTVNGIGTDVMPNLLEFIYFGKIKLEGWEFTCQMLEAAFTFKILELFEMCERSLLKEINAINLCCILDAANSTGSGDLKVACLEACEDLSFAALSKKSFREAREDTVAQILSVPRIRVANEIAIFKAMWEWAAYKCCKEGLNVNEDTVAWAIHPHFQLLGLDMMSDKEIAALPPRVVKMFKKSFPTVKLGGRSKQKRTDAGVLLDWSEHKFLYEESCDSAITVMSANVRFPCSRTNLSDSSRIFAKLFEKASPEGSNVIVPKIASFTQRGGKGVVVEDLTPSTVYTLLMFLSLKKLELNGMRTACAVYTAAHKYKVLEILPECLNYIKVYLNAENVCGALECAISCGSLELIELCKNFILESDIHEIMNTRSFRELSFNSLKASMEYPCFKMRNIRLPFEMLWKRAAIHCCEQKMRVTLDAIWKQIAPLSKYMDLGALSMEEMQCIPVNEYEKLGIGRTTKQNGEVEVGQFVGRAKTFIVSEEVGIDPQKGLPKYIKTFWTTNRNFSEVCLKGNTELFKFSTNKNAYLPQFSISHLGPPMFNKLQSIHIYKRDDTLAMFNHDSDDDLSMSTTDSEDERIITFKSLKPMYIEAYKEHTVEVNYGDSVRNLIWALVSLVNNKDGDFEITIHSEKCYGLNYLSFSPIA